MSEKFDDALDRDSRAMERIARAFERIADAAERAYPPEKENREPAVVILQDEDQREQYSDKPSKDWIDETEAALPSSRFQERLQEQERQSSVKAVRGNKSKRA